jgi:anti-anti-sigma factor
MAVHESPLLVESEVRAGTATVVVPGKVDVAAVDHMRQGLDRTVATRPSRLVAGLEATSFIDWAPMHAIAQARRAAPGCCQIILRSPNRPVRRVIELTGTDRVCLIGL